ncbi:hypothetical protein FD755_015924, partial [Muntiacus reevesi]
LLEFSVGKVRYLELSSFPDGAIWSHISSNVTFIILQIHLHDPIPGGYNLEFEINIDASIYLEYNFFETTITFTGPGSRWRLQCDTYQLFLPEKDHTEEALLRHLHRMAEVPQVQANAVKGPLLNTSMVYVTAHMYACSFEVSTKVFLTLFALLRLFISFFGYKFWKIKLFFIGFIFMGFFFFKKLFVLFGDNYFRILWWFLPYIGMNQPGVYMFLMLCMLCVRLVLGFLIATVVFFTSLRNPKIFPCRHGILGDLLFCGFIGSYLVVLAMDNYVYISLFYITLKVYSGELSMWISADDFIILAVYQMLAVNGIIEGLFQKEQPAGERTPLLL